MAYISTRQPAPQINVDNANISLDPYAQNNLSAEYQAVGEGTHVVPAGAYEVEIYNDGLQPITVNGREIPTGNTWKIEARSNPATLRLDLTPAVTIVVPAGGAASYYTISPSS